MRVKTVCTFVFLFSCGSAAFACKCAQEELNVRVRENKSIFTAEVIGIAPATVNWMGFEGPGYRVYLKVLRSLKGRLRAGDKDVFGTYKVGGSCGVPVTVGQQFLVYASSDRDSFLGRCNSSTGDQMSGDVTKLDAFFKKHGSPQPQKQTMKAAPGQGSAE
jgi:hypothetical protein